MSLKLINQKNDWNQFVLNQKGNFMQSWEWGNFREKNDITPFRIKLGKSAFQLEKRSLALGKSYFYLVGKNIKDPDALVKNIQGLAKKENVIFFKAETLKKQSKKTVQIFKKAGFKESNNIQPKNTSVLDISPGKEDLLASFHKKHRYNIRLAGRKGVKVKEVKTQESFESFYDLIKKTDKRKGIKSFPKKYYEELFELSKNNSSNDLKVYFLTAHIQKSLAAGLIMLIWKDRATYLVGASNYKYRKYMAPHLLQWGAIKLAKKQSCHKYDFWGVIKRDDFEDNTAFKAHPWAGITRFKEGFNGEIVDHQSAYTYIFNPLWYKLYRLARIFK